MTHSDALLGQLAELRINQSELLPEDRQANASKSHVHAAKQRQLFHKRRRKQERSMLIIKRAVKKSVPRSCHVILTEPCITSISQLCLAKIKPSHETSKQCKQLSASRCKQITRSCAEEKHTQQQKKQPNERRPARSEGNNMRSMKTFNKRCTR